MAESRCATYFSYSGTQIACRWTATIVLTLNATTTKVTTTISAAVIASKKTMPERFAMANDVMVAAANGKE